MRVDEVWRQRNYLVAVFVRLYPSGIVQTDIPGEWHGCCYIQLPAGQIGYHYGRDQSYLFSDLPLFTGKWDGHDGETVHDRLMALGGSRCSP